MSHQELCSCSWPDWDWPHNKKEKALFLSSPHFPSCTQDHKHDSIFFRRAHQCPLCKKDFFTVIRRVKKSDRWFGSTDCRAKSLSVSICRNENVRRQVCEVNNNNVIIRLFVGVEPGITSCHHEVAYSVTIQRGRERSRSEGQGLAPLSLQFGSFFLTKL